MTVEEDFFDLTPYVLRVRRAEFDRCTAHGEAIAVRDDGRVVHVVSDTWDVLDGFRGAIAFLVCPDGTEVGVGVEPCDSATAVLTADARHGTDDAGTDRHESGNK